MLAVGSPRLNSASRVRHFIKMVLKALYLHVFSSACPKEFLNVSWSGTFEGEFATQNCPRGAAGESNSGKISGIIQKASREY